MRAHAKAVRNGLERLLLLVNGITAAPPPGLMHERPVRRIHQADDAVIDTARQFGRQVSKPVLVAKGWHARRSSPRIRTPCESPTTAARFRHEDPDEIILFFAGVAARVNAVHFDFLI